MNIARFIEAFSLLCVLSILVPVPVAFADEAVKRGAIDEASMPQPIHVACVGDSITAGLGTSQRALASWDGVLGRMLGEHWQVNNFGSSGRTLLQHGDLPYQTKGLMKQALASKPEIVVVMLGTNDTKPQN